MTEDVLNETSHSRMNSKRGLLMQMVTAFSLSVLGFNMGACLSFTGVFTEQMTSEQADIALTSSQISWVASAFSVGSMPGFLLSSYANPRLGAVRVAQLCAPIIAGGWLLLAFGNTFWTILTGRALTGVGVGIGFGPVITHIGEIASAKYRGMLSISLNLMISAGMLSIFLCGWQLGWRYACLAVGIAPASLMFLVTFMLPRSPKWLIAKGYSVEEAQRSLRFYHGHSYDVDKEIQMIRESLGEEHKHNASLFEVLNLLKHRHNLIPFCLMLGMYTLFIFSGGLTTVSYAPVIFKEVGGSNNPYLGSTLVGGVRVLSSVLTGIVIRKSERQTLLMINGGVGGVICLVTGCCFFFSDALANYRWILPVCLLLIVGSMSLGVAPLVNLLQGELLPNAIRTELGGILLLFSGSITFAMIYIFPLFVAMIGMSGVYWFFTAMHVVKFFFAKLCLPLTAGKSIEEIQKIFEKN